ncbi:uncharacterized protein APR04_004162 [Promicromonospora umidemergens]|uniref:DUF418 domain-containing protein n=1 Tax=Promicromonospora umidemergens TaxID=629679 RepID=A0ABP8XUD2_9MICO|nr:DUF418 domain-containing protein [Promicromonospora umidemergens]MCP2285234.1 uncharacterized protein [Promicromonospora umidemergens]
MPATTPPSTPPAKALSARAPDAPAMPATPSAPGAAGRIVALDVLRGVAILGTLASNIWIFTTPGGPAEWISDGFASSDPVQRVLLALVNGKFLGLLTLLFGVGLELQYRSMVRRGLPWPGRYALRAGILFLEGLLHYILVFEFDVLMGYAIASLLAAYLIGRSDRVVRAWGGVLAATYVAGIVSVTALLVLSSVAQDTDAAGGGAPTDTAASSTAALSTASWLDQVLLRITHLDVFRIELILIVPSATVLFLVGSRLVRAGMFSTGGARLRRRLAWAGLGAGLPLNALTTWAGPDWFLVDRYLVPPLVALGILALGTTLVDRAQTRAQTRAQARAQHGVQAGAQAPAPRRSPAGLLRRGVEAVGRTALSCYVLQNVLASALCYDWGLGLAGGGGPWQAVAIWAGISLALMVVAPLWLRRWPRGPIELLMHRVYDARRR